MKNFSSSKIKDNKGFTIVELIVVIAVIAIIAVIVTPRFTAYVEKSRRGTDRNAVKEVAHAAQVAYVGIKTQNPDDNTIVLTIDSEGVGSYSANGTSARAYETENLVATVNNTISAESYIYKSKMYRNSDITITIDKTDGSIEITALGEIDKRQTEHDNKEKLKNELETAMDTAKQAVDDMDKWLEDEKNRDVVEEAKEKIAEYDKRGYRNLSRKEKADYILQQGILYIPSEAQRAKDAIVTAAQFAYDAAYPELVEKYNDAKKDFEDYQKELDKEQSQIDADRIVAGELDAHIKEFD